MAADVIEGGVSRPSPNTPSGTQLWAKDLPLDAALHRFTVGEEPTTDLQLLPWDILGSAAHARTLAHHGYLSVTEAQALLTALESLHSEALAGTLTITPEQEDCHTALEALLVARCGEAGKRIHLGRSRNDQVILALRLLLREAVAHIGQQVSNTAASFLELARRHAGTAMPGYTHTRRAMPSSWDLWATAFAEGLLEETEALTHLLDRLDRCPLGAAAGFGPPLPLDRAFTAATLGFSRVQRNPIDVMNSRGRHEGAIADALASTAAVLEKAFWDLAFFSLEEVRFVVLPDAFTTGSSIMPQKRNPDVLELARATCRQLRGQAGLIHAIAGGLPSSYHRDVQLLKAPILAMLRAASDLGAILPTLLGGLKIDAARCTAACTDDLFAAHEATALAQAGLPFRDAYRVVAQRIQDGTFRPDRRTVASAPIDLATPSAELEALRSHLHCAQERWSTAMKALWTAPLIGPSTELP